MYNIGPWELVLIVLSCMTCALIARSRGHRMFGYAVLGVVLPVIGVLFAVVLTRLSPDRKPQPPPVR